MVTATIPRAGNMSDIKHAQIQISMVVRAPHEKLLAASGREGLLADESGHLLEGLTSNLFVLAGGLE